MYAVTRKLLRDRNKRNDRPDGLLQVSTGRRCWTALIEGKVGKSTLDSDQAERYIELGKSNGIDALVTVSNDFVALPWHTPVQVSKRKTKRFGVYHWSWMHIVTTAKILLDIERALDPEREFMLREFVRFLDHEKSGANRFEQMNAEWKDVTKAHQRGTRLTNFREVSESTVAAWHQEQRDLCLQLTEQISRPVEIKLGRKHKNDPEKRVKDDAEEFTEKGRLTVAFRVPDLASDLEVTADAKTRIISTSMKVEAPQDRKSSKARLNWLLRQINTDHENIFVRAYWPYRSDPVEVPLAVAREDPHIFDDPTVKYEVSDFEIALVKDIAGRFSGRRTFIQELESLLPLFYSEVAQHIKAWVPPPPKFKHPPDEMTEETEDE